MHETQFVILPGFLGQAREWLEGACSPFFSGRAEVIDFWSPQASAPLQAGLIDLARWVNSRYLNVLDQGGKVLSDRILLGYSFGGRVALQALAQAPFCWDAAIFLSTHPGIEWEEGFSEKITRKKRLERDQAWAESFLVDQNWNRLMQTWDAQAVLNPSKALAETRLETEYSRQRLALGMRACSLAKGDSVCSLIRQPVLWLWGERDEKFRFLMKQVSKAFPFFAMEEIPRAGHRVYQDQWAFVQERIEFFINTRIKKRG